MLSFCYLVFQRKKIGDRLFMGNNPRKHIGILQKGKVWNYSNSNNKVVSDLQAAFITKFTRAYKKTGTTVEFYYGTFV